MNPPVLTAFYAGCFGMLFLILSVWVSVGRAQFKVHHGDGGHEPLRRRIRSHANFVEYVPLTLLLVGLNEALGAERWTVHALLIALLVARLVHPFGMTAPEGSMRQYALRAPAMMVTWTVLAFASGMLVFR
ncbi:MULTISPECIES: MAPEG family protein [Pseudomonas aeruginosa group]|uniref:MAPEG family protein n=1 Tax=Pseudomonas aeruginosa group TaxID=136841 RepID=UPI0021F8594A|nr:MAPEG family protein [Pseudomonas aeruginosa]UYT22345.1 glutathione S-transferase [Pseudomonas aeruginosa]